MGNREWNSKKFSELTTSELYSILKVRTEVFVVEQNCSYLDPDGKDPEALHLWTQTNGEIQAYCRIFAPGIQYKEASIGRVLTSANARGKGLGRKLLKESIEIIESNFNFSSIRISAQDYLLDFYQDFGFVTTGNSYLEDGIPHSEMLRKK